MTTTIARYREMTTGQLIEWALHGFHTDSPPANRLIYALAKRLEQEKHRVPPGNIKVGKPHISLVPNSMRFPVSARHRAMYKCMGPFESSQYGNTPTEAYNAWAKAMQMRHQFTHNRR